MQKLKVVLPYKIIEASERQIPILLSIPHCGTIIPEEIKAQYNQDMIVTPDDTDWFVQRLYDFAPAMGITIIHAVYSRWVIDLNRDPESKPLYTDGRIITPLCPTTDFFGTPIYNDERKQVEATEVQRRTEQYYVPYHQKLNELRLHIKKQFGNVLLWECHSIRQFVPTINQDKFPDLILGDADGTSASAQIIDMALQTLKDSRYQVNHNHPFKGGYITRQFCSPQKNEHALQLEMSKINYMDDTETKYDEARAGEMRALLQKTLSNLTAVI
jgi:N-formylglutamate deformylase